MAQLAALDPTRQRSDRYSVELKHVSKSYGDKEVYADLHFQLLKGTFVALLGPIGSGKTTLVNMLAGLEAPSGGSITVMGRETTVMGSDERAAYRAKNIGVVPQTQSLIPELTVLENVMLPLFFMKEGKEESRKKAEGAMGRVGILGEAERAVETLSVGERQMVSFARALVNDPPILILDEPTEALDPLMAEVVIGLLRGDNMTKGRTLFVTTHDRRVTDLARKTLRVGNRIP